MSGGPTHPAKSFSGVLESQQDRKQLEDTLEFRILPPLLLFLARPPGHSDLCPKLHIR